MSDGKLLDERTLDTIWEVTNNIYLQSCQKVGYDNNDLKILLIDGEINEEEFYDKREALDEVYRLLLCKLSTSMIQNIISAATSGQQRRAPKTIDTLATELFERELKGEGNN